MKDIDFIGIGTPKCGTSWLAECLKEHPQIKMPKREFKYFNDHYQFDLSGFKEHYELIPNDFITGEYSSSYILSKESMQRIHNHFPKVKVILVIRNPIDRAISQYKYYIHNIKRENEYSFKKALTTKSYYHYTLKGLYAQHLKNVYEIFPKENVYIILYDEIKNNPNKVIKELYSFLGVNSSFLPEKLNKVVNPTKSDTKLAPHLLLSLKKWRKEKYVSSAFLLLCLRVVTKAYKIVLPIIEKTGLTKNKNIVIIEPEALDEIYNKYFKKDILELENLTGYNLNHWKRVD